MTQISKIINSMNFQLLKPSILKTKPQTNNYIIDYNSFSPYLEPRLSEQYELNTPKVKELNLNNCYNSNSNPQYLNNNHKSPKSIKKFVYQRRKSKSKDKSNSTKSSSKNDIVSASVLMKKQVQQITHNQRRLERRMNEQIGKLNENINRLDYNEFMLLIEVQNIQKQIKQQKMMIKKILDHMDNLRNGKINKKVESSKALIKSESKKCRQMLNSGSCRNLLKI